MCPLVAILENIYLFYINFKNKIMETDKKRISIIKKEDINREIEGIKISYEKNKEFYAEQDTKLEDVINTLKIFSEKSSFFAQTITIAILSTMSLKDYTKVMRVIEAMTKAKIIKKVTEIIART